MFTLSIVIAAGSLFGMVRFGPVELGAAGVLRGPAELLACVGLTSGYATLLALAILVKIICIQLIVGL
ncbi:hypothetical protein [Streptomyces sp. NPDC058718]|uniref:hypothetical protein n=1 Tax=Streptomyces sp. NPDC058718 TaxID=3346610 RepID=UPI0036919557